MSTRGGYPVYGWGPQDRRSDRIGPDNPDYPRRGDTLGGGSTGDGGGPPVGLGGTPALEHLQGASAAWRTNREAQINANKAKVAALGPSGAPGWRTDPATGKPYYYQGPGGSAASYQDPAYKAWVDSMVNPVHDSFSARRFAPTGPSLAMPTYTPPVTPPPPGGGGGGSVTETPSTHLPAPTPYFPIGQSGMGQAPQQQTRAVQQGTMGGGPQPTGSQPGQGFAPANAPNSQQATQQGAMYGGRTNRMAQAQGIADYNQQDPNAARRPSPFTTVMPSAYRNNRRMYGL